MKNKILLCTAIITGTSAQASTPPQPKDSDRPNILCLAFEDMSYFLIGCYGNKQVNTPNIDYLAANGIQYTNAWSTAPQSSPARSSLITGAYATTYGMDIHPVAHNTPPHILFPDLLREAGYFCTNNSKTHYNTTIPNKSCWDISEAGASYNSQQRNSSQPFFAVFNTEVSHMGRIRTFHTEGRRDYLNEGIDISKLELPAHIPDFPETRSDYAAHLEAAQDVDKWVGLFLHDLKERGLDDNTIIFVYSDHGGCLPRGKGYLYETGLKIPFVTYFPPRWQHLAEVGKKNESLVSFVDFAPTILSLAGIDSPHTMQGHAFLGKKKAGEKKIQFAFASNQLHHYMPVRAATDGKYKYMRNYIPHRLLSLRNYYQWGMPSNIAWDSLVLRGENDNPVYNIPFEMQPTELLFDIENDPWEINNLSGKEAYKDILLQMRAEVSQHIRSTNDLGFFLPSSREGVNLYQKVRDDDYPLSELYRVVELAGTATKDDTKQLLQLVESKHTDIQFWAVVGLAQLARNGHLLGTPGEIKQLLKHNDPYLAAEAAYICFYTNEQDLAISTLLNPTDENSYKMNYSVLECLAKDRNTHSHILKHKEKIEWAANNMPAKENEDVGLMAKGILADLRVIEVKDIYKDFYQQGIKLNKGRRISKSAPN